MKFGGYWPLGKAAPTVAGRQIRFRSLRGLQAFEKDMKEHRVATLVGRRQYGKTTGGARIALKKMMQEPGHTVLFGSVKLDLGREMVRKEAEQVQAAFALCADERLKLADGEKGSLLPDNLQPDDFAELYEALRLEFRYYHPTGYSRTKVIALTPEAVGETGDLIVDEFERVKRAREVWEAIEPFISRDPNYRCIFTLTPPEDDRHPSFEMFAPPVGLVMPVRREGNLYKSDAGFWVRRVTAFDAYADGVEMFDADSGKPIAPEAARAAARDKAAWDRNYGCEFLTGGSAAIDLVCLSNAQQRGIGRCTSIYCESDSDFQRAIAWLRDHLAPDLATGIGFDVATTSKGLSNPSSLTVTQRSGVEYVSPLNALWRTADPSLARERLRLAVECCRAKGADLRRLAIDATNERYFAEETRQRFLGLVPVVLVVAGETVEPHPAGYDASRGGVNYKTWTADLYCAEIADNHYTLPPEHYFKKSHRLVVKSGGRYECEVDTDGDHGDTFDSGKLAQYALVAGGGGISSADQISGGSSGPSSAQEDSDVEPLGPWDGYIF
jgi:hypothetical protein